MKVHYSFGIYHDLSIILVDYESSLFIWDLSWFIYHVVGKPLSVAPTGSPLFFRKLNARSSKICSRPLDQLDHVPTGSEKTDWLIIHPIQIPSGNLTVSYWKLPFIVSFPINSMVIFHSYVNLPEGIHWISHENMKYQNWMYDYDIGWYWMYIN